MQRTHFSLYYLAGYLLPAGLALLLAPDVAFKLFLSTGSYGDVFPRVAGMLLLALFVVVVQIIRHHVEVLYSTTLVVRSGFVVGFIYFFSVTRDPFFLIILAIVAFGMILTGTSFLLDRMRT